MGPETVIALSLGCGVAVAAARGREDVSVVLGAIALGTAAFVRYRDAMLLAAACYLIAALGCVSLAVSSAENRDSVAR